MSQTGRYRVTGWGSSVYGYTAYNLGIINISHIGVNSPWQTGWDFVHSQIFWAIFLIINLFEELEYGLLKL